MFIRRLLATPILSYIGYRCRRSIPSLATNVMNNIFIGELMMHRQAGKPTLSYGERGPYVSDVIERVVV